MVTKELLELAKLGEQKWVSEVGGYTSGYIFKK